MILALFADEEALHRLPVGVVLHDAGRREGDGADLKTADGLDVEVAREVVERLAEEAGGLGVEERVLAVDVVGAFLPGGEGELAEGEVRSRKRASSRGERSWRVPG